MKPHNCFWNLFFLTRHKYTYALTACSFSWSYLHRVFILTTHIACVIKTQRKYSRQPNINNPCCGFCFTLLILILITHIALVIKTQSQPNKNRPCCGFVFLIFLFYLVLLSCVLLFGLTFHVRVSCSLFCSLLFHSLLFLSCLWLPFYLLSSLCLPLGNEHLKVLFSHGGDGGRSVAFIYGAGYRGRSIQAFVLHVMAGGNVNPSP